MNWKVGDIAICITPGSAIYGLEVIVTSSCYFGPSTVDGQIDFSHIHHIDPGFSTSYGRNWCAEPRYLIPIPDDKDNKFYEDYDKKVDWDEKIFVPEEPVTVEPAEVEKVTT